MKTIKTIMMLVALTFSINCFSQVFSFDENTQREKTVFGGYPRCNCTSLGSGAHSCPSYDSGISGQCAPGCKCDMAKPEPTPYVPLGTSFAMISFAAAYLAYKKSKQEQN